MQESIEFEVMVGEDETTVRLVYDPELGVYEMKTTGGLTLFSGDWSYLVAIFKRAIEIWGDG